MNKFSIEYVDKLSGTQFEFYCAKLMELTSDMTDIHVTQPSNDHGADVITRSSNSDSSLCIFQCKHLYNPAKERLGYRALEETAAGKLYYHAGCGALVTNGYVSKRLIKDANQMGLGIISRSDLKGFIAEVNHERAKRHLALDKQTNKLLKDISKQYRTFLKLKSSNRNETLKMALKKYDHELRSTNNKLSSKLSESSDESDND